MHWFTLAFLFALALAAAARLWLAMRHVQQAAFKALLKFNGPVTFYWRDLIEDAKRIMAIAMRSGDVDQAIKAAAKILDTATKMGDRTLADRAGQEDQAQDLQQLAEASLGPRPPVVMLVPAGEKEH